LYRIGRKFVITGENRKFSLDCLGNDHGVFEYLVCPLQENLTGA